MVYRLLALLIAVGLLAPTASAEPISFLVSVGTAISAGALKGAAAAVAGAVFLTSTAFSVIGVAMLLGRASLATQGTSVPSIGAGAYKHVLGRTITAGHAIRRNSKGEDNKWFFECRTVSAGRIQGFVEIRVNDYPLNFGSMTNSANGFQPSGNNQAALADAGLPKSIDNNAIYFELNLGDASEPVGPMLKEWGGADANARHQPHATAAFRANIDPFQRMPTVSWLVDGEYLHDPRVTTDDVDDPATWSGSDTFGANPALAAAWYLMQPWSFAATADEIDWNSVTAAANICDELVNGKPRYRMSGVIGEDEDREDILNKIVSTMAGWFVEPKMLGQWQVFAGAYEAPVADIINDDIGTASYTPFSADLRQRLTIIRGKFQDPASSFKENEFAPVYIFPALRSLHPAFDAWWIANPSATYAQKKAEAEKYRQIEGQSIELTFVTNAQQAQYIAHIKGMQAVYQKRWEGEVGAIGEILPVGRNITLMDDRYAIDGLVMKVERILLEDLDASINLVEDNAEIWTAPDFDTPSTVVGPSLPIPVPPGSGPTPAGGGSLTFESAA